jgi:2-oxoglutarate ferredoxin oxidoreductase subunit delta
MSKVILNVDRCKSCGYCVVACPKAALNIGSKANVDGYNYVELDDEKCIGCGICYTVCPDYVFSLKKDDREA